MRLLIRQYGRWLGIVAVLMMVGVVGCDQAGEAPEQSKEESPQEYHSPFFLDGDGELDFGVVTFTDVGLVARDSGPAKTVVLEAIAESLARQLATSEEFEYSADVEYDASLKDPASHLYCDREHMYVALWRGYDPDRWGYSLWSGCHDQQKFEWNEVQDPYDRDEVDTVTWVEPLTESIVESVEDAYDEECFSRTC